MNTSLLSIPRSLFSSFKLKIAAAAIALVAPGALAGPVKPVEPDAAIPFRLADVRLTGGPLKEAQDADAKYLLSLDVDTMMYYFYERAGLTNGVRLNHATNGYGGWDGGGRQLTGHIAGHYLSAISYMYAATGDPRFKERANKLVDEMAEVQKKQGDGYLGALMGTGPATGARGGNRGPGTNQVQAAAGGTNAAGGGGRRGRGQQSIVDGKVLFAELNQGVIRSGGFDLNGMWSPWYVEHKIFSGLRDAYRLTGNKQALQVEIKFAGWIEHTLANLNDEQDQRMLRTEFGGINESLVDLYADTGDTRWLALSYKFLDRSMVEPLAAYDDVLGRKHGNANIPKLLGELERYVYTGDQESGDAAKFFWNAVAFHHSFATGGNGLDEYFGSPDKMSDEVFAGDQRSAESCNVYNMLKMTRELFALTPNIRYPDFQERALFNHVLASINDTNSDMCYMVSVGRNVTHEYQDMYRDFTCCVGSGMENHALNGDGIYYKANDRVWVNLYAPSTASWSEEGAQLTMETGFPIGDDAKLTFKLRSPKEFTVSLRRPAWAGEGFSVSVDGQVVTNISKPDTYIEVKRTWKDGDVVALNLPKKLHLDALTDDTNRVAVMWGPLVLAGDLGSGRRGGGRGAGATGSVFTSDGERLADWITPVAGKPGTFQAKAVHPDREVDLVPFYELPGRMYEVYWDTYSPQQWAAKSGAVGNDEETRKKLEAATVGFAQPGQMQTERDFNEQGGDSSAVTLQEHYGRRANDWFSFDLPVDATHPTAVSVTYNTNERETCNFDILVDGQKVGSQSIEAHSYGDGDTKFFDVKYSIPASLVAGKQKVTVKFQAASGSHVGAVYGIRMLRADLAM